MVTEELPSLKLCSKGQSGVLSSLDTLVKASGQRDSQRVLEFEELRRAGRKAQRKLKEIQELHSSCRDERRSRDLALTESLNGLATRLEKLFSFGSKLSAEHAILESLRYKRMADRHEKIVDAQAKTFEWIYHDYVLEDKSRHERIFVDWLAHGNGVFWIRGKAGSGKSTLMKFLSHHEKTRRALELWSRQQQLVVASFYFWYAGTDLQRSQEGLLQSLVYEILSQCPELIPVAVPQRWERSYRNQSSSSDWTRSELATALKNLTLGRMLPCRFCCFIDGLDEYYGDHRELIDLIQNFTRSEDIKFCLSSRPWNIFEVAFGNDICPQLRLEDLTKEDIRRFVRDKLEDDDAFRKFREGEEEDCVRLVNEVVQRADGVFLWVSLVVRSLTSGLANADRIVDLQRRLDSLPDDLEEFFKQMLDTFDPTYSQQAAQTFQVALEASESLSLMTYSMLDELETNPEYALNLERRVMSEMNIRSRHDDMKLRINARCKDLLKVTRVNTDNISENASMVQRLPESFLDYQVDFLHRTVRDFFHTRHMSDWIEAHLSKDFNCNLSLCRAFVAQLKTAPLSPSTKAELRTLSDLAIGMTQYAHRVEVDMGVAPTELLDSVFNPVTFQQSHRSPHITTFMEGEIAAEMRWPVISKWPVPHNTLAFAVHHELMLYVTEKLDDSWGHVSLYNEDKVLVQAALHPYSSSNDREAGPRCNHEMLCLLISKGVVTTSLMLSSLEHIQIACKKLYSSWAELAHSLSNPNNEQLNGSLESGLGLAQRPRILQWVMGVLKSLNKWWEFKLNREEGSSHQNDMTEVMVTVLQRGVGPNWSYGKCTLWIYFVVSLTRHQSSTASRRCALRLAKEFVRCGALLEHDMSVAFDELTRDVTNTDIPWDGSVTHSTGRLPARELLQKVFSEAQMEDLTSVGIANKPETAQDGKKRREKQKEKKRRRKRRKQGQTVGSREDPRTRLDG